MRAAFFLLFILLFSCQNQDSPVTQSGKNTQLPDQSSWDATFEISINGITRAVIWSGYTEVFNRLQKIDLSDSIHVDMFDKSGLHQSILMADSGIYFQKSNNFTVWDHVRVISDSGIVLKTDILEWDNKRQKIFTRSKVVFYTEKDTLFGDGFESDGALQNYEIINPRGHAIIRSEDEK